MTPEAAMRLALAQARRTEGRTHPNPAVGAVVFRGDRVLGRGRTRPPPGPHAEVIALAVARRRFDASALRGASVAVTLEPCSHQGRTGPCTEVLIEAGIARVFVGHTDPSRHAQGRGLRKLRAADIAVKVGVLEAECRFQNRGFLSVQVRGRPYITVKLAATLDGRIATRSGESRWISGPQARTFVQRLRARVDAIAVGAGTAGADDPELVARRGQRVVHRPVRVVVDTNLRIPLEARLFEEGSPSPTWVVCGMESPMQRRRALEARGVRLLPVPTKNGHADLGAAARVLAARGLTTLLVEGGGELAAALLREDLVDELHWIVSPTLIGGDGVPALGSLGVGGLDEAVALEAPQVRRLGRDVHIESRVRRPGDPW